MLSAKKDAAEVKKLAATIHPMTCEIVSEAAPQGADEKKSLGGARRLCEERSGVRRSRRSPAPRSVSPPDVLVDLISTLEQYNPKSKYLGAAYGQYLVALDKTGAKAKIPAIAEKALANFPENDDLLMYMTETAMAGSRPTARWSTPTA